MFKLDQLVLIVSFFFFFNDVAASKVLISLDVLRDSISIHKVRTSTTGSGFWCLMWLGVTDAFTNIWLNVSQTSSVVLIDGI